MTEARILLGVSATLQGTVALTFGLAFFGLWRGFGRRAALRWTIAWMVYGVGVLNTAAGLAFGFGNRWPTLGQAFLSMPLLIGVLLFRTGTEVVADPERAPIDAGLVATVAGVTVLVVVARLAAAAGWAGISPAMVNYVLPRLIMGGAYAWAFVPLARMAAPRSRQGITLLGYALVLLALRMFLAAAYELLQMARGLPQQPESLPLTIAQLSLLIVFGVATAVVLIDAEREAEVRLEAALLDAQRLDSLGHMAGGIAHDFGNTLVSIVGGVELAADEAARGVPPSETIAGIGRSAERGIALTRQLLTFARRHAVSPQRFDAGARAESIRSMLAAVLGPRIELSLLRTPESCGVHVDPTQFDQVLLNLAINARDAMPGGGRLTIRVGVKPGAAHTARIQVEDTGQGIAANILPRIFEPFFTTKPEGRGTGLGLSTAYGFARQAGGMLSVESTQGAGTQFFLDLPRVALEAAGV